jgi:hypothetical protein
MKSAFAAMPDAKPRSWQITEERKEAFGRILRRLEYDQSLPGHTNYKIQRAMELLRAMLREAGQWWADQEEAGQ